MGMKLYNFHFFYDGQKSLVSDIWKVAESKIPWKIQLNSPLFRSEVKHTSLSSRLGFLGHLKTIPLHSLQSKKEQMNLDLCPQEKTVKVRSHRYFAIKRPQKNIHTRSHKATKLFVALCCGSQQIAVKAIQTEQ